jgi:peptidoglycan/xylan/chitin deacetylase (PgdA/CDA1 family)
MHDEPLVLMYHSVETYRSDPHRVTVDPRRFDQQMRWLRRRGRRGVGMRELLAARRAGRGRGLVGLTFDDGYRDFVTEVMPVLHRYGFGATVFVVAGEIGRHNSWDDPGPHKPLMSAAEVRRAAGAGVEIGSHSLVHTRMPGLGDGELFDHVGRSHRILAELTGTEVTGFCYPYGAAGPREAAVVRDAGYDYACAVQPAVPAGRHTIPRTFVGDRDGGARLWAKTVRHHLRAARRPSGVA